MKQLNERKPIQQDINRSCSYRKKYGAAEDKAELDAAFAELKSKAKNVSGDSLVGLGQRKSQDCDRICP